MAAGATTTPFLIQLIEALSALSVPLGGGLAYYARQRNNAKKDRDARESAARIASDKAAADARREEQSMRDKLLAEKDISIARLEAQLAAEQAENEQLRRSVEELIRNNRGKADG